MHAGDHSQNRSVSWLSDNLWTGLNDESFPSTVNGFLASYFKVVIEVFCHENMLVHELARWLDEAATILKGRQKISLFLFLDYE